jgi:hypothetical protein
MQWGSPNSMAGNAFNGFLLAESGHTGISARVGHFNWKLLTAAIDPNGKRILCQIRPYDGELGNNPIRE